jgi:ABC-type sugar transport system ATPase subunit
VAEAEQILEMSHISKSFPGVQALEDVSMGLAAGEVFAVVGENGAGKSTLIKILSGVYNADWGEIHLQGERVLLRGPKDAIERGINTIYQETSLVQDITVAENIFLGRQPTAGAGRIDWKRMLESARGILDSLSMHLAPNALVSALASAQQQQVEIAKAFSYLYAAQTLYLVWLTKSPMSERALEMGRRATELSLYIPSTYDICGSADVVECIRAIMLFATDFLEKNKQER